MLRGLYFGALYATVLVIFVARVRDIARRPPGMSVPMALKYNLSIATVAGYVVFVVLMILGYFLHMWS